MSENPFERASEIIMERGWAQHVRQRSNGSVCLMGALALVLHGNASARISHLTGNCVDELRDVLGMKWWSIAIWNDMPDRTESEVHAALHDASLLWKERHAV